MAAILYPFYTSVMCVLLGWMVCLYQSSQHNQLGLVFLIMIIATIVYDNLLISVGRWIESKELLLRLSHPRFLGHVTLTPFSVTVAYALCQQGNLPWAITPNSELGVFLVTLILIIAELLTYYRKFQPTTVLFQGTLRYTNSGYKMPPYPSIVTTILVGVLGYYLWQQLGYPWLLVGSIVMFIGGAIPQNLVGPTICSGVEVILMTSFCITAETLQHATRLAGV